MRKFLLISFLFTSINIIAQTNIFFDDFSTFNQAKLDGQNGWSAASPTTGNGTGACAGVSCLPNKVVAKVMSYPSFANCTQALNPVDGTLATGDGPGKSLGTPNTSGAVYVSMLVNFNSPLANTTSGKQVVRMLDNGFGCATRLYIKLVNTGGAFQVGVDKNGGAVTYSSASYAYGQDHLIILKYIFNTNSSTDDVASVFVDPDLTQPEPSVADCSVGAGTDATTINRIAFPWNSTFNPNGYIGAISVSTSWTTILNIDKVTDLSFSKTSNNKGLLSWQVKDASANIKTFVVEKSFNGIEFTEVNKIAFDGVKTYNQLLELDKAVVYARLKVINKDYKISYSNIFSLSGSGISKIKIENTVLSSKIKIVSNTSEDCQITVTDFVGRILQKQNCNLFNGENYFSINNTTSKLLIINIKTKSGYTTTEKVFCF